MYVYYIIYTKKNIFPKKMSFLHSLYLMASDDMKKVAAPSGAVIRNYTTRNYSPCLILRDAQFHENRFNGQKVPVQLMSI